MQSLQAHPSPQRRALEFRASAVLELNRRKAIARHKEKTVYGIVCPKEGLLRCIQECNGEYIEVDKEPSILSPLKLEPFITIYRPIVIIEGGRGGAKSETVSSVLAARIKDYGLKVGCFREFQNEIADSVHSIITKNIAKAQFPGFDVKETKITHENGGSVKYRGLARNPGGIKSMDDFDIFWAEEGQYISFASLELLEPTLRKDGSQIIYTMNKRSSADPISQEHLVPYEKELARDGIYIDDQVMVIRIGYEDNPWFPANLEGKRLKNKANWSEAKYSHIWGGDYDDTVDNAIITKEMFDACIDAHIKLGFQAKGIKVVSHDPSDEGDDAKGDSTRHGSVFTEVKEIRTGKIEDGMEESLNNAIEENADVFTWDCDGMGVGSRKQVVDALAGKKIEWYMFKGSEGVDDPDDIYQGDDLPIKQNQAKTNKQTFKNKRSQKAWALRDKCYNTWRAVTRGVYTDPDDMISFSSEGIENMAQLRSEMCRIPLVKNSNGYIQIMTKKEMWAKYKIPSPNMFDSVMMNNGYIPPLDIPKKVRTPQKAAVNHF